MVKPSAGGAYCAGPRTVIRVRCSVRRPAPRIQAGRGTVGCQCAPPARETNGRHGRLSSILWSRSGGRGSRENCRKLAVRAVRCNERRGRESSRGPGRWQGPGSNKNALAEKLCQSGMGHAQQFRVRRAGEKNDNGDTGATQQRRKYAADA